MPRLKVRNASNLLVIDEGFANLGLRSKGAFSVATAYVGQFRTGTLSIPSDQGILAFRCANPCCIVSQVKSGANMVYSFLAQGDSTVEYWQFDLPSYATLYNTNAKLIFRRPSDGVKIFDSRTPYLRVNQFIQLPGTSGQSSFGYEGTPAIVQVKLGWTFIRQIIGAGGQTVVWNSSFARTAAGTVTIDRNMTYFNSFDPNPNNFYPRNESPESFYLIADVTNF